MKIRIELLSDAIFGSGKSMPGGEDITILCDKDGFPYYPGSAFRGIYRKEFGNFLHWTQQDQAIEKRLFGEPDMFSSGSAIKVSDFELSDVVKRVITGTTTDATEILNSFTYFRAFTSIEESGCAKEGSLRTCRCLIKGLVFYGDIECEAVDQVLIEQTLPAIKWIGSMRNRGFGRVKVEPVDRRDA